MSGSVATTLLGKRASFKPEKYRLEWVRGEIVAVYEANGYLMVSVQADGGGRLYQRPAGEIDVEDSPPGPRL